MSKKNKYLRVRVTEEMMNELDRKAANLGITKSAVVSMQLTQFFKDSTTDSTNESANDSTTDSTNK